MSFASNKTQILAFVDTPCRIKLSNFGHMISRGLEVYPVSLKQGGLVKTIVASLRVGQLRGPLGLRKFVILCHDFFGSDSKPMELQNSSQLIVDSWFIFVLISFCNCLWWIWCKDLCVIVQPPKPTFFFDEI